MQRALFLRSFPCWGEQGGTVNRTCSSSPPAHGYEYLGLSPAEQPGQTRRRGLGAASFSSRPRCVDWLADDHRHGLRACVHWLRLYGATSGLHRCSGLSHSSLERLGHLTGDQVAWALVISRSLITVMLGIAPTGLRGPLAAWSSGAIARGSPGRRSTAGQDKQAFTRGFASGGTRLPSRHIAQHDFMRCRAFSDMEPRDHQRAFSAIPLVLTFREYIGPRVGVGFVEVPSSISPPDGPDGAGEVRPVTPGNLVPRDGQDGRVFDASGQVLVLLSHHRRGFQVHEGWHQVACPWSRRGYRRKASGAVHRTVRRYRRMSPRPQALF